MRVEESTAIEASPEAIWELVRDPSQYPRFMPGITRFDIDGERTRGTGARYTMHMSVGSAHVGGLVEIVEYDEPNDMAWTSVTGIDQRGRWRLREQDDGTTLVTLRLSYTAPGTFLSTIADVVSSRMVGSNLRESLERLRAKMEGTDMPSDEPGLLEKARMQVGQGLYSVKTLVEAGLVRPERVDRTVRALLAIQKWGFTPAAGYAAAAVRYPNDDAIIDELGRLTFGEVEERTNRLANGWLDSGLGEGDAIAVMCRNHRYFIEATVAAAKLGITCIYLNTAFGGPQLADVVKREKPAAIVYDEEFAELLADAGQRRKRFVAWHDPEDAEGARKDTTLEELIESTDAEPPLAPEEEGRAIILTSGT